jgi:hypothetical protein
MKPTLPATALAIGMCALSAAAHAQPAGVEVLSKSRSIYWSAGVEQPRYGEPVEAPPRTAALERIHRSGPPSGRWSPPAATLTAAQGGPAERETDAAPLPRGQAQVAGRYDSTGTADGFHVAGACEVNISFEDALDQLGEARCSNEYRLELRLLQPRTVVLTGSLSSSGVVEGLVSLRTADNQVVAETQQASQALNFGRVLPPGDYVLHVRVGGIAQPPFRTAGYFSAAGTGQVEASLQIR